MKKTIILLTVFCLLLTSYKTQAVGCYMDTISTYGVCTSEDGGTYSDSVYMISSGYIYVQTLALIMTPNPAITQNAYASVSWNSTGPVNFRSFNLSSDRSTDEYYYDPYAIDGNVSLYAYTVGAGTYAGVTASW